MAANTSVSGVIPAYNSATFVGKAIESALAQTHPLDEIVVVDDGSSDNTAEVAAQFPKTKVIRRPNGGIAAARNTGIQAASGEWIAFLDHDDRWAPEKTEVQLQLAAPGIGVIHSNPYDWVGFASLWQRHARITPSGALVRKQTLAEVGGFDESREVERVEDLNLWLRIALTRWGFVRAPGTLFHWTPAPGNASTNTLTMARAELANIDRIGSRVRCSPSEMERLKRGVRLEYARNLIGEGRGDQASELLNECASGVASHYLRFTISSGLKRMARTDVLGYLHSLEPGERARTCPGGCVVSREEKARCRERNFAAARPNAGAATA